MKEINHEGFLELIVSYEEFIELIRPDNKEKLSTYIGAANHKLIYRGQSDSNHLLIPSLFRDVFEYSSFTNSFNELCFCQFAHLKSFVAGCDTNAVAIPNDSYEFREKYLADYNSRAAYDSRSWPDKALYELLGFAQHYGYPTELLDWSYSPLVASYFAASGVISNRESSLDGYMSVWVFDLEKKNLLNDHKKTNFEVINIPRSLNLNISSQQGCFTLVRQDINRNQKITYSNKRIQEMKLLPDLMAEKRQNGLLKLTVSNKNSLEILEFCDSYSINAASLFRGPYGAAQYAIEGINKNRFASKNSLSINGSIPL